MRENRKLSFRAKRGISLFFGLEQREIPRFARSDNARYFFRKLCSIDLQTIARYHTTSTCRPVFASCPRRFPETPSFRNRRRAFLPWDRKSADTLSLPRRVLWR